MKHFKAGDVIRVTDFWGYTHDAIVRTVDQNHKPGVEDWWIEMDVIKSNSIALGYTYMKQVSDKIKDVTLVVRESAMLCTYTESKLSEAYYVDMGNASTWGISYKEAQRNGFYAMDGIIWVSKKFIADAKEYVKACCNLAIDNDTLKVMDDEMQRKLEEGRYW